MVINDSSAAVGAIPTKKSSSSLRWGFPLQMSSWALFVSLAVLGVCFGLLVCSNAFVLLSYGYGTSTRDVSVWHTCVQTTTEQECYSVFSNSQCSELSSRMNAVAAFSIISAISSLGTIAAFAAEGNGMRFPVLHLSKMIFGWCVLTDIVCVSIGVGTLVATLCSDPRSMLDQNGTFGPAFYTLFVTLILHAAAGALYAFYNMKKAAVLSTDAAADETEVQLPMTKVQIEDL
jgi:hypothetical protein